MSVRVLHGDCFAILPTLAGNSIDAVVTDPPYGLEFMGKDWDGSNGFRRSLNEADTERANQFGRLSSRGPEYRAGSLFQLWCEGWATECLRVLKPGGHLVAFGGSRTYHRLACGVEDAGFEIRDQLQWLYGQGFPKHKSVLKPAHEPIVLARKPVIGSIKRNVETFGTGGLNVNGCRIETVEDLNGGRYSDDKDETDGQTYGKGLNKRSTLVYAQPSGRWPANVIHDGSQMVLDLFPDSKGQQCDVRGSEPSHTGDENTVCYGEYRRVPFGKRDDSGSAARFFYCAKATKTERAGSKHPTVKPIALMQWLARLVTPVDGVILDPFAGSGTTGIAARNEGFDCILIEREADYIADIDRRIANVEAL